MITMEALRFGSSGDNVEKWQIFLRGQKKSSQIIANGEFDQTTVDETKNFQKSCGLVADGIVGPATILAASQRGFLQLTQKHNNWPTIPPGVKNISPLGISVNPSRWGAIPGAMTTRFCILWIPIKTR